MHVCADDVRQDQLRECARRSVEVVNGVCIVRCHAIMNVVIDVRDLRLRFRLRLCLYLHVQQTLTHNSG